jgi:hypothetical protein
MCVFQTRHAALSSCQTAFHIPTQNAVLPHVWFNRNAMHVQLHRFSGKSTRYKTRICWHTGQLLQNLQRQTRHKCPPKNLISAVSTVTWQGQDVTDFWVCRATEKLEWVTCTPCTLTVSSDWKCNDKNLRKRKRVNDPWRVPDSVRGGITMTKFWVRDFRFVVGIYETKGCCTAYFGVLPTFRESVSVPPFTS